MGDGRHDIWRNGREEKISEKNNGDRERLQRENGEEKFSEKKNWINAINKRENVFLRQIIKLNKWGALMSSQAYYRQKQ